MMKFFWLLPLTLLACSPQTDPKQGSDVEASVKNEPTFISQKFEVSFSSELPDETLQRAQTFVDRQIASVMLISLIPDCQILDGEKQCYESSVLSSPEGDSLKIEELPNLSAIRIDDSRFGKRKPLQPDDMIKLLPALFKGDEKEMVSFCYLPRHAIAFYGEKAELTGFLEICFECSESVIILDSLDLPPLSQTALNGLGSLFLAYGFEEKPAQNE